MHQRRRRDGRDSRAMWISCEENRRARICNEMQRALERCLPDRIVAKLEALEPQTKEYRRVRWPERMPWREWSKALHLDTECVVTWAYVVSQNWRVPGRRPQWPQGAYYAGVWRALPPQAQEALDRLKGAPGGPLPKQYSRQEYLDLAGEAWDEHAAILRAAGWEDIDSEPTLDKKCEWVVRYRSLGDSPEILECDYRNSVSYISQEISRIERLLNLEKLSGPS